MRRAVIVFAMLAAVACGRERTTPTIKPLPSPHAASPLLVPGPLSPRIADYRIDARYDAQQHQIAATETITWRNAGGSPVSELCIRLYMNAFRPDSRFMTSSGGAHRGVRADASALGGIDVSSIAIAGADQTSRARYDSDTPDRTVMMLPLPAPLEPGEEVSIDMAFDVDLPRVFSRVGFDGAFAMVGHWFPKVGVRVGPPGEERWACEPFHLMHEFFSDFGVYDVSITVPDTHVVAATGILTDAADNGDGTRTHTFRAEDVHDFAWMTDPYMQVRTARARVRDGEVDVRVYHRPEQRAMAVRHLDAAVGAVEEFSELLVPYPYAVLTVIDPPLGAQAGAGGVEYPTLVTTSYDSALADTGLLLPELVTIHEVGHNWLQGIVASNEVDEPWLDEGVNEYLDAIVLERLYGDSAFATNLVALERAGLMWLDLPRVPIATKSSEFPDFATFGATVYTGTLLALRTLEHIVGREPLLNALGSYARKWAFRHPRGGDLFAALESSLGRDLAWYLEPVFLRGAAPAYAVRSIYCDARNSCEVVVVNNGDVAVPVDVRVSFDDGEQIVERWDDGAMWRRFGYQRGAAVAAVEIDPDWKVLINRSPIESGSSTRRTGATRRAAASASFWTQTAMQVLGL